MTETAIPVDELIACRDCGLILEVQQPEEGGQARCPRCDSALYRRSSYSLELSIALNLSALVLFGAANLFPFLIFKMEGRVQSSVLLSGIDEFVARGFWFMGGLVFLATILAPLAKIAGSLYVLIPVRLGLVDRTPGIARVFRWTEAFRPWSMMEVFLLGVIVAYVKLVDVAAVELGPSLYAFVALVLLLTLSDVVLEAREVWTRLGPGVQRVGEGGQVVTCHACEFLHVGEEPAHACPRCGAHLHHRKPNSLARCAALVLTASILYIPANVFPIMTVISFGDGHPDTISSGVVAFIESGMWPLALLVFFASIMVPLLKLIGLAYLLLSVWQKSAWRPKDRTQLYRIIDSIGRWSMIDVFMIGILVSLVRLGAVANIEPGIGATAFAVVVVVTIFASHSFDPRLIWDRMRAGHPHG